jgi:hypothetical protein
MEEHARLTGLKEIGLVEHLRRKLLILEFLLVFVLDHPSGSFKVSIKKIFSHDTSKVFRALDLYHLIIINQK